MHRKVEGVFILEGFLHFLFDESCHLFVSLRIIFDQFPEIVIELKMRKRNVLFPLNDYFPAALFSQRLNLIVKMEIFTNVRHWNTQLLHAFNWKCHKITQFFISPYRQSQQASLSCHWSKVLQHSLRIFGDHQDKIANYSVKFVRSVDRFLSIDNTICQIILLHPFFNRCLNSKFL